MSSAISSVGSSYLPGMGGMGGGPRAMKRPDSEQVTSEIFSKLDTDNQGYLEASDFGSDNEDLFAALDSDSDGKVSKDELSTRLKQLEEELDSQFNAMRSQGMGGMMMAGGIQGMPPPPPPAGGEDDAGLGQEQLSAMAADASEAGDSVAAAHFAALAENFDSADSNQDGKVSFAESIAYEEAQRGSSTGTGSEDGDVASADSEQDGRIMMRLMAMLRAYGSDDDSNSGSSVQLTA
ncbi:EF-hand domain-containing protein [Vogesella indigofera]|uniref:EF-hand domain-containing protein n=1 Tax=Vogesella indigofera TaxID=45465 RepID=UPI00234EEE09|nr:EF-hand domain-containing protein [Vogesella indigofera]MDC7708653.1 EF-hand domain-containing protein [Vogesella indigofera]